MARKTSSGFFTNSESLPYHVSRGYDSRTCQDMPPPSPATRQSPIAEPQKEQAFDPSRYTLPYVKFMTENPTIFHAVHTFASKLEAAGFEYLNERKTWSIKPGGKYYVKRNNSSFIAFSVGKDFQPGNGFGIVAGHIDAVCAKLKPISKLPTKEGFLQLGVAPYAGGLSSTWWDRDLGIGGRVLVKHNGKVEERLVKLDWPIARIPTLAVHFGAASQGPFNPETQAVPIIGLDNSDINGQSTPAIEIEAGTFAATQPPRLVRAICGALNISDYSSLVNWELELFDTQPAAVGGLDHEFIFAGRIDDKLCCYAAVEGLLSSSATETSPSIIKMVGCFDDEEIGSQLRQGAQSSFMSGTIERILSSYHSSKSSSSRSEFSSDPAPYSPATFARSMANSFLISSDVIHAVNPNFLGQYLPQHSPRLNIGVAISCDPNGHMTTDAISTAFLKHVASRCGATLQTFQIRNDSRSGGTIGPMTSSRLGCRAVDCGIPQLSMHSIRATTGSLDPGLGVNLYKGFFDYYEEVDAEFE